VFTIYFSVTDSSATVVQSALDDIADIGKSHPDWVRVGTFRGSQEWVVAAACAAMGYAPEWIYWI
jgi:hypothetical protein